MACNCGKNKQQWEVVTGEGDDTRILYTSPSKVAADSMASRYTGATVRPKPAPVPNPRPGVRATPRTDVRSSAAARTPGGNPAAG